MSSHEPMPQDACDCCQGVSTQSPVELNNRPGLAAIDYRIGTHSQILTSLLARLSSELPSENFPALAKLRTRDRDDFSIALLDAYACMADVLTFYQERLINESYLRTASERFSMSELAKLIDYRLKPGVAAETYLAFTLEELPLPAVSSEPKQASGVPDQMMLPIGIKVQSIPGPDEKPQIFETIESIEARPAWNVLKPRLTQSYLPISGRTDLYLQGILPYLKAGDGLLFIGDEFINGTDKNRWQFRRIATVTLDTDRQHTRVTWDVALTDTPPAQNPQVHVFRKRVAVFGHNAPMWCTMPEELRRNYPNNGSNECECDSNECEWPDYKISPCTNHVDLDAVYSEVIPHSSQKSSWLFLATDTDSALFKIISIKEISRAAFAMSTKLTRAELAGDNYAAFEKKVRETVVYAASEQLSLAEAPDVTAVNGYHIVLSKLIEGLQPERKLFVTGREQESGLEKTEMVTLQSATPEGSVSKLTFKENLNHNYQRDSVRIYANVARATHGESVQEILGSGAARQKHQRFVLKHAPLTHTGADNESGAEAALEVRVNDILWHETSTLFTAKANDPSYVLRIDESGAGLIQFGDGKRGARLPTGQENVRARYRKGIGTAGNLKAGQLSQLLIRPLGLKAVSNPLAATGGVEPDSTNHARRNMPLGVRTLGRVVSLRDYEDFARAYTGIAKAQAAVLNTHAGRTVVITVAGDQGQQPSVQSLDKLINALKQNGDPGVRCEVLVYKPVTFSVALRIKHHPDHERAIVLKNVEDALRAAFNFDARDFGQPVARSEVITIVQKVAGVLGVDLDRFDQCTDKPQQCADKPLEERLFPNPATVNKLGRAVEAEILLLDTEPFDMKVMP